MSDHPAVVAAEAMIASRYRAGQGGNVGGHPDPIGRDLRAYTWACVALGVLVIALTVGLYLKQAKKHKLRTVNYVGCYVWSDGFEQCQRGIHAQD